MTGPALQMHETPQLTVHLEAVLSSPSSGQEGQLATFSMCIISSKVIDLAKLLTVTSELES